METKNLYTLYDISIWEHNVWQGWKDIKPPIDIEDLWLNLKASLTGAAPTNLGAADRYIWEPSGGKFMVRDGYKFLQTQNPTENWNLFTTVWKTECIPKVKHFNWTLLKGKVFTSENLRKRGILGPSICCFCRTEEESSYHLFYQCPLAQSCWKQMASPLELEEINHQLPSLQKNWARLYPFSKKGKGIIIRVWKCIPATLCWKIWLARNNCIFNDKKPNPARILAKTIALISEIVSANLVAPPDRSNWHKEEEEWLNKFHIKLNKICSDHPKGSMRRTHNGRSGAQRKK